MSLTAPNPIIKPFCNTGTQVAPPVGADSLVANQETGFPLMQIMGMHLIIFYGVPAIAHFNVH